MATSCAGPCRATPKANQPCSFNGGPGSGLNHNFERMFDPARYFLVQFDQRNCGQSTPYAGALEVDLSTNTTGHTISITDRLVADRPTCWGN